MCEGSAVGLYVIPSTQRDSVRKQGPCEPHSEAFLTIFFLIRLCLMYVDALVRLDSSMVLQFLSVHRSSLESDEFAYGGRFQGDPVS